MKLELNDIDAILESFQRSAAMDLLLSSPQFELRASKRKSDVRLELRGGSTPVARAPLEAPAHSSEPASASSRPQPVAPKENAPQQAPEGHVFIKAANLGTFYRSPKPGAPPYVNIGDEVTPETEVCLIEVMKLFTPLYAGIKGIIREVVVSDSALVEFDQPLFLVEVRT